MEVEQSPHLPTSGEILGVLVKAMGFQDEALREKTARRYFSGRQGDQVKERSRWETLEAIVDTLAALGFQVQPQAGEEGPHASVLESVLDEHAVSWDQLRAALLPRMMRIYPSNLPVLWRAYLRLACIDLAVRVAALLRYTGSSVEALDFLDHASRQRRGAYLKRLREKASISLLSFPDEVGVVKNTAEAWLYHGAKPLDEHLVRLGEVLAKGQDSTEVGRIVRELRLLYWVSDVAEILGQHIGAEAVDDLVRHLHRYASRAYQLMGSEGEATSKTTDPLELVLLGVHAPRSSALLAALAVQEGDDAWRADLSAAASDWVGRVLQVNLEIHQGEVSDLLHRTEGRILKRWDIHNPQAYEHYQRSEQFIVKGRIREAIAEVKKAFDLDPQDPVNHFTFGSAQGGIGNATGDDGLIRQGIEACWLAHALDPAWAHPWTEIGLLLLYLGKAEEAVAHLEGVAPGCGPLDARYHAALGAARSSIGAYRAALQAYEHALALNPDDPAVAVGAAVAASMVGDRLAFNRLVKAARFLGAATELDRSLRLAEAEAALVGTAGTTAVAKARNHFLRGDDDRAVAELDAAVALDASNADAAMLRGVIHGYTGRHEQAVADLSAAIALSPGSALAHLYRGLSQGELDQLESAIDDFDAALRLDPGLVQALEARGECRMYLGQLDAAIADFDAAMALDPDSARSFRGRGSVHRARGEYHRAIADYDTALRLDEDDAYTYRFRGHAHLAIEDFEGARADFDAAIARGGGNAMAYVGRAAARDAMGDAKGAERDYQHAQALGYENP